MDGKLHPLVHLRLPQGPRHRAHWFSSVLLYPSLRERLAASMRASGSSAARTCVRLQRECAFFVHYCSRTPPPPSPPQQHALAPLRGQTAAVSSGSRLAPSRPSRTAAPSAWEG
eukprot:TRINITY_DN1667_c0_g1_i2.p4 TRINITY_DN1667_c0_g1~~TRINITY_DN1667_c0_g1_i2.p4  ORF type:complete len:114 (+),score=1.95 TRINITY_DN1667_c0_g1_i2:377-718(+)